MEAIARFALRALVAGALVGALLERDVLAEDVRDPASGVAFWAPDGWTSHTEASAKQRVLKRTSPDGRVVVGLFVGEVSGDEGAAWSALETQWRAEGTGVESLGAVGAPGPVPAGAAAPEPARAWRLTIGGRTLSAFARLRARGDVKAVLYVAHDPAVDGALAPVLERIVGSLSVPWPTPAGDPTRPAPVPAPAPVPVPVPAPPPAPAPLPPPAPVPGPAPAPSGSGLLFDPAFREGRPAEALVLGGVPLLRGDLDAVVDAVEAGWDTALTAGEEQALRDGIESAWKKLGAETQDLVKRGMVAKAAAMGALSRGDALTAHSALKAYVAEWQAKAEAAGSSSWADALRTARTRRAVMVAVAGEPPVSGAAMDALEAAAAFLLSLARNDATTVTDGQRLAVREDARKTFGAAGALVRGRYAAAHRLWLLVKARWDTADAAQRLRARFAAVAAVRRLEHAGPWTPAHPEDEGLKGYARAAASTAAAAPLFDAYAAAFANPEVLFTTALEVSGLDPRDLDAALNTEVISLR